MPSLVGGEIVLAGAARRRTEALVPVLLALGGGRRRSASSRLDDVGADQFLGVEGGQPADQVLQLADVAGPAVALQPLHARWRRCSWPAGPRAGPAAGSAGPGRDVLRPLAQRRQADRHDVEAEEQVLAEQALLDQGRAGRGGWRR